MKVFARLLALSGSVVFLSSATPSIVAQAGALSSVAGVWQGTATVAGGKQVPVSLRVSGSGDALQLVLLNGPADRPDETPASTVSFDGTHLVASYDYFARKLEVTLADGTLTGTYGPAVPSAHGAAATPIALTRVAKLVDPESRKLRKIMESQVAEPKEQAYDKIAQAKFAIEGTDTYPDATFTLRLSYGKVAGYELGTTRVAPFTTFYGLYDRALGHAVGQRVFGPLGLAGLRGPTNSPGILALVGICPRPAPAISLPLRSFKLPSFIIGECLHAAIWSSGLKMHDLL